MSPRHRGAARAIIEREVGGDFEVLERLVPVGTARVTLMGGDPERVAWLLVNRGAFDVFFGFDPSVTAADGNPLAGNGGTVSADVREDLVLPTWPVHAVASADGQTVRVTEVRRTSDQPAEGA